MVARRKDVVPVRRDLNTLCGRLKAKVLYQLQAATILLILLQRFLLALREPLRESLSASNMVHLRSTEQMFGSGIIRGETWETAGVAGESARIA